MNWFTSWFSGGKTATKASPKAVAFGTKMMLGGGLPGGWATDHREEANHFVDFNYIAIMAIANQYAGSDIEVYADGTDVRKASVAKSRRKSIRQKHFSVSRFKSNYGLDEKETTPLEHDHPLVQLLKNPNPYQTGLTFRQSQAIQLRLTGTCFIWNVPGKGKTPCERYVMPTSMLTPVRPQADMPMGGYRVSAYSSRYIAPDDQGFVEGSPTFMSVIGSTIDARQVQVVRLPHAWWFDDGQSPVSAGARWIDMESGVNAARIGQLRNGADPSIYIELPEDYSPDQDEMDRITHKMSQKYSGPENSGKVMIGPNGSKPTLLSTSPKDMCYAEAFQDSKASVLALHNTPEVAVGLAPPGAYAAYYASMLAWRTSAIQPMCDMFAESDTMHLAPQFGEGLTIEVEAPMVDDKDQEMKELQTAGQLGLLTVNEGRARLGLPPLKDGKGEEMAGAAKPAPGANGQDQQVDNNTAQFPTTPYGKSATLQAAIDAAEDGDIEWLATKLKAFNSDQPRDSDGKWTGGGIRIGKDSDASPTHDEIHHALREVHQWSTGRWNVEGFPNSHETKWEAVNQAIHRLRSRHSDAAGRPGDYLIPSGNFRDVANEHDILRHFPEQEHEAITGKPKDPVTMSQAIDAINSRNEPEGGWTDADKVPAEFMNYRSSATAPKKPKKKKSSTMDSPLNGHAHESVLN